MAVELTQRTKDVLKQINLSPNLVFRIKDIPTIYSSAKVQETIKVGDPGLVIGNDWKIGGVRIMAGVHEYLSFGAGGGTTTKMQQKISPDRAQGSSVTSIQVTLIDKNEEISEIVSPGFIVDEILGRQCWLEQGFKELAYPEDYFPYFQGIISDIDMGAGFITFFLTSTEEKKRKPILKGISAVLNQNIADTGPVTTIDLVDASSLLLPVLGPDGLYDNDIEFGIQIGDELFKYTGISGNQLTGVTRSYLSSVSQEHDTGESVNQIIRLIGNGIDLALKLMLSGKNDYYETGVELTSFNVITPFINIPNAIYFEGVDIAKDFGVTVGTYITTTGATNGANNVTLEQVSEVVKTDVGSYIVIDGVSFVDENPSSATISFRSKYDTLGIGLKMKQSDIDMEQHEYIRDVFLNSFELDIPADEIADGKSFLENELYLPMGCFSVPRKAKSSMTYTIGPLPGINIPVLDVNNVLNPSQLKPKRSIAQNFSNVIEFKYDYKLPTDKYDTVDPYESANSKALIKDTEKVYKIESKGMRTYLNAQNLALNTSDRLLARYQYGAEFISNVKVHFGFGLPIEIGDVVLVDYNSLKLTDTTTGNREGNPKLMEVINKSIDTKTGELSLDLLNTAFQNTDRYGRISPSSKIASGSSQSTIKLKKSFGTNIFEKEWRKWVDYVGEKIVLHDETWSFTEESTIKSVSTVGDGAVNLETAFTNPVTEDMVLDIPYYPTSNDPNENIKYKAEFAHAAPEVDITASASQTKFNVAAGDISKFFIGSIIQVHDLEFTNLSVESEVISINNMTYEVEIADATGFTITAGMKARHIGFPDEQPAYRYI